jgi:hypothetical protein
MWQVCLCEFSCPAVLADEGSGSGDFIGRIYCDLILPQPVGSSLARCLRSFTYVYGLPCAFIFDNTYMPVEITVAFKNIRIEIIILTGKRVPFESSETPSRFLLNFRRHRVWD